MVIVTCKIYPMSPPLRKCHCVQPRGQFAKVMTGSVVQKRAVQCYFRLRLLLKGTCRATDCEAAATMCQFFLAHALSWPHKFGARSRARLDEPMIRELLIALCIIGAKCLPSKESKPSLTVGIRRPRKKRSVTCSVFFCYKFHTHKTRRRLLNPGIEFFSSLSQVFCIGEKLRGINLFLAGSSALALNAQPAPVMLAERSWWLNTRRWL